MAAYYSCTAEMHKRCSNNTLCHLCDGERLFKDPVAERKVKEEEKKQKDREKKEGLLKINKSEKKAGMAFEEKVQKQWNEKFGGKKKKQVAKPRIDISQEYMPPTKITQPKPIAAPKVRKQEATRYGDSSGSLWFSKGDIRLEHALMECKEYGTMNARGEKQITIPKAWLEKQEKEAHQEGKPFWYLPFGYKNDGEVYLIKPYNQEMEIIYELRRAREEIERLKERLGETNEDH